MSRSLGSGPNQLDFLPRLSWALSSVLCRVGQTRVYRQAHPFEGGWVGDPLSLLNRDRSCRSVLDGRGVKIQHGNEPGADEPSQREPRRGRAPRLAALGQPRGHLH